MFLSDVGLVLGSTPGWTVPLEARRSWRTASCCTGYLPLGVPWGRSFNLLDDALNEASRGSVHRWRSILLLVGEKAIIEAEDVIDIFSSAKGDNLCAYGFAGARAGSVYQTFGVAGRASGAGTPFSHQEPRSQWCDETGVGVSGGLSVWALRDLAR